MADNRNNASQNQPGNQSRGDQGKQSSGQSAAWESEQKLDREEKTLIGDEAQDRNLTGSTTYVTLPEQEGDTRSGQSRQSTTGSNSGATERNPAGNRDSERGNNRS